jgi:hypothetical protein
MTMSAVNCGGEGGVIVKGRARNFGHSRRHRLGWLVSVILVSSALQAAPGRAEPAAAGAVLDNAAGVAAWAGSFEDVAAASEANLYSQAGVCEQLGCRESIVAVALPAGVWAGQPGGVQFSIGWAPHEKQNLDLYVYGPDGSLAGSSAGFASTSEAVRVRDATNGRYRVVVVPQLVDGTVAYRGYAEVEREPAADPLRPLLPNLVTFPSRNPQMKTAAYLVDHEQKAVYGPSCYPEEMTEQGARRCLRFDQVIANTGEGPFEIRYRMDGIATDQQLRQRIFSSDGSFNEVTVDKYVFHPTHAHFHYKNFGQAFLHRLHPDGTLEKVRESRKNGFCMIDVDNLRFGVDDNGVPYKGEAARAYYFPRCNAPTERDEHGTYMVNGMSVGWADVYNWYLADQYIEISGVPDGLYVIETVANPARSVHEASFNDNSAQSTIRLHGDTVTLVGDGVRPS